MREHVIGKIMALPEKDKNKIYPKVSKTSMGPKPVERPID